MFHWDVITVSSRVVTKLVPNCFKLKERNNLFPPSEIREENFVSKGIFKKTLKGWYWKWQEETEGRVEELMLHVQGKWMK